mmetsp:Transcript_29505/g.84474  ORF Transcript_29505/g.84474 Transcript_29505/m.84474 type:complete len:279 (-) Transcript_29505:205-1041(-)
MNVNPADVVALGEQPRRRIDGAGRLGVVVVVLLVIVLDRLDRLQSASCSCGRRYRTPLHGTLPLHLQFLETVSDFNESQLVPAFGDNVELVRAALGAAVKAPELRHLEVEEGAIGGSEGHRIQAAQAGVVDVPVVRYVVKAKHGGQVSNAALHRGHDALAAAPPLQRAGRGDGGALRQRVSDGCSTQSDEKSTGQCNRADDDLPLELGEVCQCFPILLHGILHLFPAEATALVLVPLPELHLDEHINRLISLLLHRFPHVLSGLDFHNRVVDQVVPTS